MTTSTEIRKRLTTELRLDLIGPNHGDAALLDEILPDPPSFLGLIDISGF